MRMSPEHFEKLRAAIVGLDTEENRATARRVLAENPKIRDLNRSWRWRLFHAVRGFDHIGDDSGYTDAHIYTALRRIVPDLTATPAPDGGE